MNLEILKTTLIYSFFVLILGSFHFFISNYFQLHFIQFSIVQLYLIFGLSSIVIIAILSFVKTKNLDNVGNTYMLTTCFKMILILIIGKKYISTENNWEKWHFFGLFIFFLLAETLTTIYLVNKKPVKKG